MNRHEVTEIPFYRNVLSKQLSAYVNNEDDLEKNESKRTFIVQMKMAWKILYLKARRTEENSA